VHESVREREKAGNVGAICRVSAVIKRSGRAKEGSKRQGGRREERKKGRAFTQFRSFVKTHRQTGGWTVGGSVFADGPNQKFTRDKTATREQARERHEGEKRTEASAAAD